MDNDLLYKKLIFICIKNIFYEMIDRNIQINPRVIIFQESFQWYQQQIMFFFYLSYQIAHLNSFLYLYCLFFIFGYRNLLNTLLFLSTSNISKEKFLLGIRKSWNIIKFGISIGVIMKSLGLKLISILSAMVHKLYT